MVGVMRQRRDRKRMAVLFARRQRRGLTWEELAAESGVPKSTLHWWHRRLRAEDEPAARSRFVRVEVVDAAAPAGPVEVVLRSGHRVRVAAGFDPEHLRQVILVLESGC
jgi:hypothetical protein